MGTISRFDLGRISKEYKAVHFFETGTFRGDGIAYALKFPFQKFTSVEIVQEIAEEARGRFRNNKNVKIVVGDSVTALQDELPLIKGNCVFWLDAHFPGADAGMNAYDMENMEELRLPLCKELETINRLRRKFSDVFILDDLRIYEDGPYENGNVPADALPKINRSIDFVYEYFEKTHFIFKCYLDEGYILIFPKRKYRWHHFNLADFFRNRLSVEDFYLV